MNNKVSVLSLSLSLTNRERRASWADLLPSGTSERGSEAHLSACLDGLSDSIGEVTS